MDMVTLVAIMGEFDFLGFQMLRQGNCFNHLMRPGLDFGIVAPQTESGDFPILFDRKRAYFFLACHMIGPWTVTEFTGNGLVQPYTEVPGHSL